jgi:mRNA deadenylase 3'-5' endonuclease subunit Ccr4/predicted RNA methylase
MTSGSHIGSFSYQPPDIFFMGDAENISLVLPCASTTSRARPFLCDAHDGGFSLLSWNILAPGLAAKSPEDLNPSELSWEVRWPRVKHELLYADADILTLQELETTTYKQLYDALHVAGYEGCLQTDDKKTPKPHLNGTFWKRSRFVLVEKAKSRSRTLVAFLREVRGARTDGQVASQLKILAVVNCHLQGWTAGETAASAASTLTRVKQLQSALRGVSTREHHAVVISGDLNCDLRASACTSYLQFGSVPPGSYDWGVKVAEEVTKVPGHKCGQLVPAYNRVGPDEFSYTRRSLSQRLLQVHERPLKNFLDAIWLSDNALRCNSTRNLFVDSVQRDAIICMGLPTATNPSDHLPLGCTFTWRVKDAPNLQCTNKNSFARDGSGVALDPVAEASALLDVCPLTDEETQLWCEATRVPENLPSKGRPSPEQLVELQRRRHARETLLGSVSAETATRLRKVLELQKKGKKAQHKESKQHTGAFSSVHSAILTSMDGVKRKPATSECTLNIFEAGGFSMERYEMMRDDEPRTSAYRSEIRARCAGKVVLDIGTGPLALLAIFCAEAGATHVYAIEANEMACSLAETACSLAGFSSVITVLHGMSTKLELPQRVDIIVHELVGDIASEEGMVATIADARQRFLLDDAVPWSIPESVQTCAVPIQQPQLSCATGSGPSASFSLVPRSMLIAAPQVMEDVQFMECTPLCQRGVLHFEALVPAVFNGLLLYPVLSMRPGLTVDAFSQDTHWPGLTVRFEGLAMQNCMVDTGDIIQVHYAADLLHAPLPQYSFEVVLHAGSPKEQRFLRNIAQL